VIVWEAAQGTPLPAYVANYTQQLERMARRSKERARTPAPAAAAPAEQPTLLPPSIVETPTTCPKPDGKLEVREGLSTRKRQTSSPKATPQEVPPSAGTPPAEPPRKPVVLVVCNKTDLMPCPMPQIQGLRSDQAFIAVSAERGTNLRHLWTMVSPLLPHAPPAAAAGAHDQAVQAS
jgi:hypothetical protein